MKEKFCKLLAKLIMKLMGRTESTVIMQEAIFPGKFLAITVLDNAEDLDAFREEQEWLAEVAEKARAEKSDKMNEVVVYEEPDFDPDDEDDFHDINVFDKAKKTLLQ